MGRKIPECFIGNDDFSGRIGEIERRDSIEQDIEQVLVPGLPFQGALALAFYSRLRRFATGFVRVGGVNTNALIGALQEVAKAFLGHTHNDFKSPKRRRS